MPSGYKAAVKTTKASEMDKHVFIKEMALTRYFIIIIITINQSIIIINNSSLQHSNIITCLGLSKAPTLAMILEFAERKSLNDLILEKFHELSQPRFTTRIALEIAEAMRFLHECGITNQDLKSQNVLVSKIKKGRKIETKRKKKKKRRQKMKKWKIKRKERRELTKGYSWCQWIGGEEGQWRSWRTSGQVNTTWASVPSSTPAGPPAIPPLRAAGALTLLTCYLLISSGILLLFSPFLKNFMHFLLIFSGAIIVPISP